MSISQIPILAERLSSYIESVSPGRGRASVEGEGPGMLQGADELSRADEHTDQTHPLPQQSFGPASPPMSSPLVSSSPGWSSQEPSSPVAASAPPSSAPLPTSEAAPSADVVARLAGGEARQEFVVARETRAAGLVG